jgi:hypothetical protein
VRVDCLSAAIAEEARSKYRYGVRGGLTPEQRRQT